MMTDALKKKLEIAGFVVCNTPEELFDAIWPEVCYLRYENSRLAERVGDLAGPDDEEAEQPTQCPNCEESLVEERIKDDNFEYGITTLTAKVPVFCCTNEACKYMWTDYRAETLREQAVEFYKRTEGP